MEVIDSEMLDDVFRFRYKIVSEEHTFTDFMKTHDFPDKKETDTYDPYSIQFAALNENNEICATVRLIHHSPIGYPTENKMKFDIDKSIFERDKLGEMSRIFVDPEIRCIQTTKIIIQHVKEAMYFKMKELGVEYTYGALEKSFIRLLKIYKMPYEMIGEEQDHMGFRYPCVLYTDKLGSDNPEIVKLWKEKNEQKNFKHAI